MSFSRKRLGRAKSWRAALWYSRGGHVSIARARADRKVIAAARVFYPAPDERSRVWLGDARRARATERASADVVQIIMESNLRWFFSGWVLRKWRGKFCHFMRWKNLISARFGGDGDIGVILVYRYYFVTKYLLAVKMGFCIVPIARIISSDLGKVLDWLWQCILFSIMSILIKNVQPPTGLWTSFWQLIIKSTVTFVKSFQLVLTFVIR